MNHSSTPAVGRDYATTPLPLEALSIHPSNVRRTAPNSAAMHELMASIVAHGLLMPLLVVPKDDDTYQVVAGGRRLTALQKLAEEDTLPAQFDAGIPAVVLDASVDAQEISLVENTLREDMSPADAIDAFRGLFDRGHDIASIALRFGAAESTVKKYVALGGVIPEALELFREGEIGMEELQALAFTDDQNRQREVFDLCVADNNLRSWRIRKLLNENTMKGDHPAALYVGIDAYRAAGGQATDDLFSDEDDVVINNPEILTKLFREKVSAEIARLKEQGWKWAEFSNHRYNGDHMSMTHIDCIEGEATEAEQAKLDALEKECEAYEHTSDFEEIRKIEAEIEQIESAIRARDTWDDEVKSRAGVMIFLERGGKLEFEGGYVRPEDEPAKEEGEEEASTQAEEKPLYARKTADDFGLYRTQIVAAQLAAMPELALDMLIYDLARRFIGTDLATNITFTKENYYRPEYPQGDVLNTMDEALDRSWLNPNNAAAGFDAFCALSRDAKMNWLAYSVARGFEVTLAPSHHKSAPVLKEHIVAQMGIDWAKVWLPDETYFARLTKTHLLNFAEELMGEAWAQDLGGLKKMTIVSKLVAVVKGEIKPTSPEHAQIIAAWVPPGFAPEEAPEDAGADAASLTDEDVPEDAPEDAEAEDGVFPSEAEGNGASEDESNDDVPQVLAG